MHHLVEAKRDPVPCGCRILKAAQVARARFDSVHDEMRDEVENRKPPELPVDADDNEQGQRTVNKAMCRERENEIPARTKLAQHIGKLQRKIRDEVLDLKNDQEKKRILEEMLTLR